MFNTALGPPDIVSRYWRMKISEFTGRPDTIRIQQPGPKEVEVGWPVG